MNQLFGDVFDNIPQEERRESELLINIQMAIATRIDELCRERGMTRKNLAALLDLHESQVSRILSGCQNLTLKTIARIEARLGAKIIAVVPCSGEQREAA